MLFESRNIEIGHFAVHDDRALVRADFGSEDESTSIRDQVWLGPFTLGLSLDRLKYPLLQRILRGAFHQALYTTLDVREVVRVIGT